MLTRTLQYRGSQITIAGPVPVIYELEGDEWFVSMEYWVTLWPPTDGNCRLPGIAITWDGVTEAELDSAIKTAKDQLDLES